MWETKYIIHANNIPIVFPEIINHSDMARNMGWKKEDIIGAGFVYLGEDYSYTCYGESVSLRVKSRGEEDEKILNRYLGGEDNES
jgi:hypothetical protein